jgi:hypothetical protein
MTSGPPQPPLVRHFWNMISRHRSPTDESVPRERPKHGFFTRRTRSKSPLGPASTTPSQPTLQGNVPAREDEHEGEMDDNVSPLSVFALLLQHDGLSRRAHRKVLRYLPSSTAKRTETFGDG